MLLFCGIVCHEVIDMPKTNAAAEAPVRPHSLTLDNRKTLSMTGVNEVISFDEKQLILSTEGGRMTIDGEGMHVTSLLLEEGRISVEGNVSAVTYSGRASARKGLGGLFR